MMRTTVVLTCIVALTALVSCGDRRDVPESELLPAGDSTYVFSRPDTVFELDEELDEISGVALMEDGRLAAVQDEDGILYVLDPSSGTIVERRAFGGSGDYEAVDIAEGRLYVLRSDGWVSRFTDWSGSDMVGDTLRLALPNRCDAEGLRFDVAGQRLLVSCKDDPGRGYEAEKAIYAFDPDGEPTSERPAFLIDSRQFAASMEDHPVNEAVRAVLSERLDLSGLGPSELAIHPVTGELFVLSSVREAVLSLDQDGTVTALWPLPQEVTIQPEGMAFLPNGDLFIASEAGGRSRAVLVRYTYRP